MSSTATLQKALKVLGPGNVELTDRTPIPQPQADEVLVRVIYVALNPVDAKSADLSPAPGATMGCDFSGDVVAVGSAVKKALSDGDRVCGSAFGNNPDEPHNGAFAEYVVTPGDLVLKIPPDMSYQTAATLGLGLATVGLGLFQTMKLPLPGSPALEPHFVLIHGGGTATGTLAIQLARMSGLIPITTCSRRNFSHVKSLGAAEAFDYHSPSCGSDIQAYTKNSLEYAFDCITDTASMKICYSAIGSGGGKYVGLDPIPIRAHTRRSVKPNWIIAFTVLNKPVNWQRPFKRDPKPKHREFAEGWFEIAQELVNRGLIAPHPHQERTGGLEGVIDGLDRIRKGKVSGVKLVYPVAV